MVKDKKEFWDMLMLPNNRGCWNCATEPLYCNGCNAFVQPPNEKNIESASGQIKEERWLVKWKWNGQR